MRSYLVQFMLFATWIIDVFSDMRLIPKENETVIVVGGYGGYDYFSWKGNCRILNGVRVIRDKEKFCDCKLKDPNNNFIYGSLLTTATNGLSCLYSDRAAGANWFLYPSLGTKSALLSGNNTVQHFISINGKDIYTPKIGTFIMMMDKIETYTYDSRAPFVKVDSNILKVGSITHEKSFERFYLQWQVESPGVQYYTGGRAFRIHLKLYDLSSNTVSSIGLIIAKVFGLIHRFNMYSDDIDIYNHSSINNPLQQPRNGQCNEVAIVNTNSRTFEYVTYVLAVLCISLFIVNVIMVLYFRRRLKTCKREEAKIPCERVEIVIPIIKNEVPSDRSNIALPEIPGTENSYESLNELHPFPYTSLSKKSMPAKKDVQQTHSEYEVEYIEDDDYFSAVEVNTT